MASHQMAMAWKPPSTMSSSPVMNEPASSLASSSVAPISSRASPNRVHRRVPHDFRDPLGLKNLAILLGGKKSGHQHVDAHAMRRPLARKVQRQVVDGALGRRVGEHARQRQDARHRADVDDRSAMAGVDQVLAEHLTSEEHALQVDANDAIELVFGDVEKRRRGVDAGAVDDDVDAAGALQSTASSSDSDFRFAGRFGGVKPRAPAGRVDRGDPRPGLLLRCGRRSRPRRPRAASPSAIAPHSSPVPPMTTATLPCSEKSEVRNSFGFEHEGGILHSELADWRIED